MEYIVSIDDSSAGAVIIRGVVGMGSMGSAEPINFLRRVLEPINF